MQPRRVVLIAFPDCQVLDVTGPLEVFAIADEVARRSGLEAGYARELAAPRKGPLRTWSGIQLVADRSVASVRGPIDTLLVAGGRGVEAAVRDRTLVEGVRRLDTRARRVGSVCTGAFLLAEAGLLDGRRSATHWSAVEALRAFRPQVEVLPDPIWVRDGKYWTSAGITAGIDLALALVEADLGRGVALETARRLVMFLHRPGGQRQFSTQLENQLAERAPLRDIQAFIADHPDADLSVPALARRSGMSPRNFARVFTAEVGITPGRFVERTRVEAARRLLETSERGLDEIAAACGFGSAETLRRSFVRTLQVNPAAYRARFRSRRASRRGGPRSAVASRSISHTRSSR